MCFFSHIFYCSSSTRTLSPSCATLGCTTTCAPFCFVWQVSQMSVIPVGYSCQKILDNNHKMTRIPANTPQSNQTFNCHLPLSQIWTKFRRHTRIWHFGERKETVIGAVRTQDTHGFPWVCFLSLVSSLLLGLRIQNRQLCRSIAPWRNDGWNKGEHSYRLERTLNRWCDRAEDDSRGSHFTPPEGYLSRSQTLACCWCAIHTAPRQSCQHGA